MIPALIISMIVILIAVIYVFLTMPRVFDSANMDLLTVDYAHRGLHTKEIPENSLAAYSNAIDNRYGIEIDVQLSSDNVIFVFHDQTATRMCGVDKKISDMTSQEIKQLRLMGTEEQIPTAAFPDESRIMETFSQDELAIVEYIEEPASEFADAFTQFRFEGYDDGMPLSDGITYAVSEGESLNLEIVRCIWTPVDNLMYIGVFNSETETGYAYAYVDGNIQVSVPFNDLPAGEYVVYVKNMGDRMITDGTLRYRVS